MKRFPTPRRAGGYSFLEVLISTVILVAGILAIVNFFPVSLRAAARAENLSQAVLLAHQKAEELRRDNDESGTMIDEIRLRSTPTDPIAFPDNPLFTYSFSGRSEIDTVDDPGDPSDDAFVPRIIVRYNANYRQSQDVLYELRFDE